MKKTQAENSDTTETLHAEVVDALISSLPVTVPVSAEPMDPKARTEDHKALTVASFVGSASADIALSVDPEVLGGTSGLDPNLVSIDDILRPTLEEVTAVLGTGVLSAAGAETAPAIIDDENSRVYQLKSSEKNVGWFAIRLRKPSAAAAAVEAEVPAASRNGVGGEDVSHRLSRLRNVHMGLTVEIGRARVSVRDVLDLEPGAVIELDRNAGAPADVRLNGRLIAQGEVVVMDQDYGVRITKILDASEGLQ